MSREMTLNVRVGGVLGEFVAANISETGAYENVSEYVRSLIRRDMERAERESFERLKAELELAFAAPDTDFRPLTANAVIVRNSRRSVA